MRANLIGKKLRAVRRDSGLTPGEVAYRAGIHLNTLYRFERGSMSTVVDLEAVLNVCGFELVIVEKAKSK